MNTWRRSLLIVAGAVVFSVAGAQSQPVTYTEAGAETAARMLAMTNADVDFLMTNYNWLMSSGRVMPVTWINADTSYTGGISFPASNTGGTFVAAMDQVLTYFYEVECQTLASANCSGLSEAPTRTTGTGLDAWRDAVLVVPVATFPTPECPSDSGEWFMVGSYGYTYWAGTEVREFRPTVKTSRVVPADCVHQYVMEARINDGAWGGVSTFKADPGTAHTDFVAYLENRMIGSSSQVQVHPGKRPGLAHWRDGTYRWFGLEDTRTAHADLRDGLRIVFAEVFAEFERVNGYQAFPTGIFFDPEPTALELGAVEPPPGDGGGGEVDPGNCVDGWYLTRVVCEIRDRVENAWTFATHDAWVPTENWSERMNGVRGDYEDRMIFNLTPGSFGIPTVGDLVAVDVGTHAWCELELDLGLDLVGPFMPQGISAERVSGNIPWGGAGGTNWCETPPAQWLHVTGRAILAWFLAAGYAVKLFTTVTGRA